MGEKFDICFMTTLKRPDERRQLIADLASAASPLISPPVWITRIRGYAMSESAWAGEPIDASPDEIVCLYPRQRSALNGAWLIKSSRTLEVWTLALPIRVMRSHPLETMDLLWRIGSAQAPCVAGAEYSMPVACKSSADVLVEAASARSLATHVVLRGRADFTGWTVLKKDMDLQLLAKPGAQP
jgi:hypothetical protein